MTIHVTDFTKRDPRSRFEKKLAAYALAGGAMLAMPDAASATIIQVTPSSSLLIGVETGGGTVTQGLDLDGDGTDDFIFGAHSETGGDYPRNWVDVQGTGSNAVVKEKSLSQYASAYTSGTLPGIYAKFVGSAILISSDGSGVFGQWPNDLDQSRFLAVRFQSNGMNTLGWIEVATHLGSADALINSWAYDAADTAVPEPSSMALFAAGAAGVAALRKRRKAQ